MSADGEHAGAAAEASALARVGRRYGLNDAVLGTALGGDERHRFRVEGAPEGFDGTLAALRVVEYGRFGNVLYQLLNAVLVARQLGVPAVELFSFPGGPEPRTFVLRGVTVRVAGPGQPIAPAGATLAASFFVSAPLGSLLRAAPPELVVDTVDGVLRPLLSGLLDAAAPGDPGTIVLSLRAGDVFGESDVHPSYVQPPASYYVRAAHRARDHFGVRRAILVSEDDGNPAGPVVARALERDGFEVARQSASLEEDFGLIARAVHLAAPYGTLCEALAMLSTDLRSYTAFRLFDSQRHWDQSRPAVLLTVLQSRGVETVRILDDPPGFIPPRQWENSAAQRTLIETFPLEQLTLTVVTDDRDDAMAQRLPPPAEQLIVDPGDEARRLRGRLIAANAAGDRLAAQLAAACVENAQLGSQVAGLQATGVAVYDSLSWRLTRPLRLLKAWLRR